jgi:hypothetical protein
MYVPSLPPSSRSLMIFSSQTFLLRHVYASTMSTYQLSKTSATFLTFLLSALCHEMVMAVVTKKIRQVKNCKPL